VHSQAAPQEQVALLFCRPDGVPSRPHAHGLQPQCSPHVHVVCSAEAAPLLADVHLQSRPPGHGTVHPHLSSQPIIPLARCARLLYVDCCVLLFSVHRRWISSSVQVCAYMKTEIKRRHVFPTCE
jgi:hypothetical protein